MGTDSLWTSCRTCGKNISKSASSCPHCGARTSKFRALKWVGAGVLAIVVLAAITGKNKPSSDGKTVSTPIASNEQAVAPLDLPDQQGRFLSVVDEFSGRFATASNELQQSALRDERRDAIKEALDQDLEVTDWTGTIRRLQTNSEGRGVLAVRLSDKADLVTWNNALSDLADGTLIESGSPLFNELKNMSVGDTVKISGFFLISDTDWVRENSLTIRGSMMTPEFLFRFQNVVQK